MPRQEIVYGRHPVMEVLRAGKRKVVSIHYTPQSAMRIEDILAICRKRGIALKNSGGKQLSQRTSGGNHQGVIALVEPTPIYDLDTLIERVKARSEKPLIVILDSIVDPQNFGAILRSAETFGVSGAIFPKDRSCDINSTIIKASAGATEHIDLCRVPNIARTVVQLRDEGFHTLAADSEGETSLSDFRPSFPLAIVVGSEGKGVRPLVKKRCDETLRIPLAGKVESLNVSAAAAVIFYAITRCDGE